VSVSIPPPQLVSRHCSVSTPPTVRWLIAALAHPAPLTCRNGGQRRRQGPGAGRRKHLIQADQALAKLTAGQARSSSLTQLRSFNDRVQVASTTVQNDLKLVRKALNARPTVNQEP
jgi:hypothetical protein